MRLSRRRLKKAGLAGAGVAAGLLLLLGAQRFRPIQPSRNLPRQDVTLDEQQPFLSTLPPQTPIDLPGTLEIEWTAGRVYNQLPLPSFLEAHGNYSAKSESWPVDMNLARWGLLAGSTGREWDWLPPAYVVPEAHAGLMLPLPPVVPEQEYGGGSNGGQQQYPWGDNNDTQDPQPPLSVPEPGASSLVMACAAALLRRPTRAARHQH